MDIASAKQQIKNTVQIYLQKDALGRYRLPLVHQRPIFLLGAPGLGKTAIMQQVADEMGLGLVSYSMTHHTRQSALGLPVIVEKEYGGKHYQVSEYTMSEIIASVYDCMRTRSTVSPRPSPLPCCCSCNTKSLVGIRSPRAGWWSPPATRPASTKASGSLMLPPVTG